MLVNCPKGHRRRVRERARTPNREEPFDGGKKFGRRSDAPMERETVGQANFNRGRVGGRRLECDRRTRATPRSIAIRELTRERLDGCAPRARERPWRGGERRWWTRWLCARNATHREERTAHADGMTDEGGAKDDHGLRALAREAPSTFTTGRKRSSLCPSVAASQHEILDRFQGTHRMRILLIERAYARGKPRAFAMKGAVQMPLR